MDGIVPKAPESILFTGDKGSPTGGPKCFNCGGPHVARECPKPRDKARFEANLEAHRARRAKKYDNDKGSRDRTPYGHGKGDDSAPKWGKPKKKDHAQKRRDRHDAKVLLAAFKASQAEAATPDPEADRDAQLSEWAGEYKPAQVLAVAGNAATYSITPPGGLGRAIQARQ